jgi:hypothetical protein
MISKNIKSILGIPPEFPVFRYFKEFRKLFGNDPKRLTREQFYRRYKFYQSFFLKNLFAFHESGSLVPIDIFIPTIAKDLPVLPFVIEYARKNVKHPISNIYIVAPNDEEIKKKAQELACVFVDEKDVLGYGKDQSPYFFDGKDASGWLFQQLLKLNSHKVCKEEHILILDSDTLIVNPKKFEFKGNYILDFSDEFHKPYFATFKDLMGFKARMPISFVCHHMLFKRTHLAALQTYIEKVHTKPWDQAIIELADEKKRHYFSEYETYANFVLEKTNDTYIFEYWFNTPLQRVKLSEFDQVIASLKKHYKTISFHSYIE